MRISAKTDYAIRACVELATATATNAHLTADTIAEAQGIPARFLLNILADLRRFGLVDSRRGPDGGWWLAKPATDISVADVIRAIDGPLANVAGVRPEQLDYHGSAESLRDVWIALRSSVRDVLEEISIADIATGRLPQVVRRRASVADAWQPH